MCGHASAYTICVCVWCEVFVGAISSPGDLRIMLALMFFGEKPCLNERLSSQTNLVKREISSDSFFCNSLLFYFSTVNIFGQDGSALSFKVHSKTRDNHRQDLLLAQWRFDRNTLSKKGKPEV